MGLIDKNLSWKIIVTIFIYFSNCFGHFNVNIDLILKLTDVRVAENNVTSLFFVNNRDANHLQLSCCVSFQSDFFDFCEKTLDFYLTFFVLIFFFRFFTLLFFIRRIFFNNFFWKILNNLYLKFSIIPLSKLIRHGHQKFKTLI